MLREVCVTDVGLFCLSNFLQITKQFERSDRGKAEVSSRNLIDEKQKRSSHSQRVSPEGFEPSTITLKGCCSTVELWALVEMDFTFGLSAYA
jgi:hypothetical protein